MIVIKSFWDISLGLEYGDYRIMIYRTQFSVGHKIFYIKPVDGYMQASSERVSIKRLTFDCDETNFPDITYHLSDGAIIKEKDAFDLRSAAVSACSR